MGFAPLADRGSVTLLSQNRQKGIVIAGEIGTGIGTGQRGTKGGRTVRWVARKLRKSEESPRGDTGGHQIERRLTH
jgi:hypothetical protein